MKADGTLDGEAFMTGYEMGRMAERQRVVRIITNSPRIQKVIDYAGHGWNVRFPFGQYETFVDEVRDIMGEKPSDAEVDLFANWVWQK